MLEEKEPTVLAAAQAEIDDTSQRRFSQIMGALRAILRVTNFAKNDTQTAIESDSAKYLRSI